MRWAPLVPMVLLALALAAPARATTVLKLPVDQMTQRADLVIRAEVTDVSVRIESGGVRPLSTQVTLRVVQVIKGHASSPVLRLDLLGGVTERASVVIPGMPSFRIGEEVVLFLERTPRGFIPAGLTQGKYTVRHERQGNLRVSREILGVSRVMRDPTGRLVHVEGPDPEDDLPLEDLMKAVNQGLRRAGGAR